MAPVRLGAVTWGRLAVCWRWLRVGRLPWWGLWISRLPWRRLLIARACQRWRLLRGCRLPPHRGLPVDVTLQVVHWRAARHNGR